MLPDYGPSTARSTDPITSHIAARRVRYSEIDKKIIECLEAFPEGLTTLEMEQLTGLKRVSISPRPCILERNGVLHHSGYKTSKVTKCPGKVWKLGPKPAQRFAIFDDDGNELSSN